jgi:PucR C-terminal helix-turn-helix domain/GGDEF-like domain
LATSAALQYLLAGVERDDAARPQLPPAVLLQARLAARHKVGLDTVLRRCFAGYSLFGDFLMQELERGGVPPQLPKCLLRTQAGLLDRMLSAVGEEYSREAESRPPSTEQRRARLTERLLAGEPLEASELGYELEGRHHLAMVARGVGAETLRELASELERHLLLIAHEDGVLWAWLGGRSPLDPEEALRRASFAQLPQVALALGEPGEGAVGWRLSHRQATAALPIALRRPAAAVRYAEVAMLASILKDDLLATSVREIYLKPLEGGRHRGGVLRETLRAYFAAERNLSSAAASLGVRRHTVKARLRAIEQLLGRSLGSCEAELDIAIRAYDLLPQQVDGQASDSDHIGRPPPGPARSG